jgi:predicted nucleic acid-binding protein
LGRIAAAAGLGSVVAIDTVVFIYYLEGEERRGALIHELFVDVERGDVRGLTSVIALLETLVRPIRLQQSSMIADYNILFSGYPNLDVRDVTDAVARRAAEIRAHYNFPVPDSVHLATAVEGGADCFLTNDRRLSRFPSLPVLVVDDFIDGQNGSVTPP